MITEIIAATSIVAYYKYKTSLKYKIKKIVEDVSDMENLDFKIIDILVEDNKIDVVVSLYVTTFSKLYKASEHFKNASGKRVLIQENDNLKTATITFITKLLTDQTRFKAIKLENSMQLYFGLSHTFQELKIDLFKYPHVLVSGTTGSGKSEIIRMALANSINNFSSRDLEIYFSDLSNMNDYDIFQRCSNVRGYARTIEESYQLFEHLHHIYNKRLSIFATNNCKNVKEYNSKNVDKRMSTILLVLDEFADYFPSSKLEKQYSLKCKAYNLIRHMVRKFRKVGIFLIIGIQRPDTTILDPSLKSGLCTKIGFTQNNNASSLVVADTEELANLKPREGLFMYGSNRIPFHSLFINDRIIYSLIKDRYDYSSNRNYNKFIIKKEEKKSTNKVKIIPRSSQMTNTKKKAISKVRVS